MDEAPRFDSYEWRGGREPMLRWGSEIGPVAVVALPLFEEANRTRAFAVAICRALTERGIGAVLPDLPGQGESPVPTEHATLSDLRAAFASAARAVWAAPLFSVAIRSGALLDCDADVVHRWHFAPMLGEAALRELVRAARASDPQRRDLDPIDFDSAVPIEVAGNLIAPTLLRELRACRPERARIVRLDTERSDATLKLDGAPLWRRAEPGNDLALAQTLAADIADWIASCEG